MAMLDDEDLNRIVERLHAQRRIDEDTHVRHHEIFERWIERDNIRRERCEKIIAQVGGWSIITLLTGLGYTAWEGTKALLKVKGGQ
jgi:hypothetical protein